MLLSDIKNSKGLWIRGKTINGTWIPTISGQLWNSMQARCKTGGSQQRNEPTYEGASCSFSNYQMFNDWTVEQTGYGLGWQLDKDILLIGNKTYSESLCVFVPQCLNKFLIKRLAARGDLPIGVSWHKRGQVYAASCRDGSAKQIYLGSFSNPQDAFVAYKTFKESVAKRLAEKWDGLVDDRVTQALLKYTVGADD